MLGRLPGVLSRTDTTTCSLLQRVRSRLARAARELAISIVARGEPHNCNAPLHEQRALDTAVPLDGPASLLSVTGVRMPPRTCITIALCVVASASCGGSPAAHGHGGGAASATGGGLTSAAPTSASVQGGDAPNGLGLDCEHWAA